jgi:hypothetical protein
VRDRLFPVEPDSTSPNAAMIARAINDRVSDEREIENRTIGDLCRLWTDRWDVLTRNPC